MRVDVARVIAPDLHAKQDRAWCDDHNNVAMLIRWLGIKALTNNWDADDYASVVEKPWKWDTEWRELQAELVAAEDADHA